MSCSINNFKSLWVIGSVKELSFYASFGWGLLQTKLGYRDVYNRITDKLVLGSLPIASKWDVIQKSENIKGILALVENFELKKFTMSVEKAKNRNILYLQLPVKDFFYSPSLEQIKSGVGFIESCPGTTYVHCKAGRSRSAVVVVCYIMKTMKLNPEQAIKFVKDRRPVIRLTNEHHKYINQYFAQLRNE